MYSITGTNIKLTRGDSFYAYLTITQDSETYTPASGDVIRFAMKEKFSDDDVVLSKTIDNDTLLLYLEPDDTADLDFGTYVYDIQMTFANGDVDTFIKGKISILAEVD